TGLDKWTDKQDSLAFGAGMTLGTAADSGYLVSAKTLFALILPGPIVLIEGKANLLDTRPSHDGVGEGAFGALAVIDNRAGEILMNVDAAYKIDSAGRVLDIQAGAEAFFDYHQSNNWHFYLGRNDP